MEVHNHNIHHFLWFGSCIVWHKPLISPTKPTQSTFLHSPLHMFQVTAFILTPIYIICYVMFGSLQKCKRKREWICGSNSMKIYGVSLHWHIHYGKCYSCVWLMTDLCLQLQQTYALHCVCVVPSCTMFAHLFVVTAWK